MFDTNSESVVTNKNYNNVGTSFTHNKKFDPKEWKFKQESFILDYRDNMVLENNICEVQDISDKVKDIFKDKTEQELYEYLFSYGFLVGCSWMSFKLIILDKKQKIPNTPNIIWRDKIHNSIFEHSEGLIGKKKIFIIQKEMNIKNGGSNFLLKINLPGVKNQICSDIKTAKIKSEEALKQWICEFFARQ